MLTWQEKARPTYRPTKVLEESRQHYANVRIAEWQRSHADFSFDDLLSTFRYYGNRYDQGYRLRDLEGAA